MKLLLKVSLSLAIAILGLPVQGHSTIYASNLDGPSESPPNASPGTGFAKIDLDTISHTLAVEAYFSGLIGNTTAAHIHGPTASPGAGTAGVMTQTPTFVGFPLGVTSGVYTITLDTTLASTWNSSFLSNNGFTPLDAEVALGTHLAAGTAYFNIHTNAFPGGEIRGFLAPAPVPEPATMLLLGTGIVGLAGSKIRKRKK